MARPRKTGLDYFSIDVDFYQNIKVRKIKMACGPQSISVLICLLCNIYRNKGYYIEWDKDLPFLIADEVGVTEGAAKEIINKSVQVGFFNQKMFENGFITSKEIQERYEKACKDSKRTNVIIREKLNLIRDNSGNNPVETPLTTEETPLTTEESTQSKVKESRVNESKEDDVEKRKKTSSTSDDVFENIQKLKLRYQEKNLRSAFCKNMKITPENLDLSLSQFNSDLESLGRNLETWKEYSKYFKNCIGAGKYPKQKQSKKKIKSPTDITL
ncbi:DUF4373 domain-containing protein [Joostella sp.]|uniref:DUF4373 domain-containing protein n=1 Tax=Joostella sp. TaxID=2231138 RepID=UPI003A8E9682